MYCYTSYKKFITYIVVRRFSNFDYLNLEVLCEHLINLGVGSSLQDVSFMKRGYVEDLMF
jgi:hypothetical protein